MKTQKFNINFKVNTKSGKIANTSWNNGGFGFTAEELKGALKRLEADSRVHDIEVKAMAASILTR